MKVDSILFERSGIIKWIQMKLNRIEEKSLKKHADSLECNTTDFH